MYHYGAELIYRNDEMGPTAYITVGFEGVPYQSALTPHFEVFKHLIGSYKKNTGLVPGKSPILRYSKDSISCRAVAAVAVAAAAVAAWQWSLLLHFLCIS